MGQNVETQVKIKASAQDVYWALIDEKELVQWFAESAAVSSEASRYHFWGRLTPGNPSQDQAGQKMVINNPGRELGFTWAFRGADTQVNVLLEEIGPDTIVSVIHSGVPIRQIPQFAVADFWMLSLENLRSWVERKEVGVRCDFSDPKTEEVKLDVEINASSEEVYDTLINPEKLKRYIGENPVVEPEVGGKYDYGWGDGGPVKILSLEPNKELSFSWEYWEEKDTVVTWQLEGSGGKTRLTLVHSGFSAGRSMDDYQVGWVHFLNRIKFLSEMGAEWEKAQTTADDYSLEEKTVKEGS